MIQTPIPLALILALLLSASAIAQTTEPANNIDLSVVPPDKFTGEPYVLAGKRVVFTSWFYVRPGGYAWKLKDGENVTVTRKKVVGPWEANFERKWDVPVGVRLVSQRPRREGPMTRAERAWEEQGMGIRQVLRDGEKFRAWGGVEDKQGRVHMAHYESSDGRKWTRPNLGMVEYEGSKENNLLPDFPGALFIDPAAPAEERYKSVGGEVE